MLIFVSDLHLVDEPGRASFDAKPMFEAIRSRLHGMDTAKDPVTLVLLGDIFELLKSQAWFDHKVRPWHDVSKGVIDAAHCVLSNIAKHPANRPFFDGLKRLQDEFGVRLNYVAGNHDGLLADDKIVGLREQLRGFVPGLPGTGDKLFSPSVIDAAHGVVAEHGHQLDPFNRLHRKTGRFVPGDAVVIEMLVGMPLKVLELRKIGNQFDREYEFLHEMDNVEPQSLSGLMRWLEFCLKTMSEAERSSWEAHVSAALRHCVGELRSAMSQHRSQPLARNALRALLFHRLLTRVSFLRKLARLPSSPANEFSQVATRVSIIAPGALNWPKPPDLYIAGHTHAPLQQVFSTSLGNEMTYLNTGTWRRFHSPVRSVGTVAFREAYQEALVCVHRRSPDAPCRYELRRYVTGS